MSELLLVLASRSSYKRTPHAHTPCTAAAAAAAVLGRLPSCLGYLGRGGRGAGSTIILLFVPLEPYSVFAWPSWLDR